MPNDSKAHVFMSYSRQDKPFARKLVEKLKEHQLNVWLDELEMKVGDSIVSKISKALNDADYLVIVLSQASVSSSWVQSELNAALMGQSSGKDPVVLSVLLEDCEVPPLLRDRLHADFRRDFEEGLKALLAVFEQEGESAVDVTPEAMTKADPCSNKLSAITLADLRRRITKRMDRGEISQLWFDVDMAGRQMSECVISLLDKVRKQNKLSLIIEHICHERPDLADPY